MTPTLAGRLQTRLFVGMFAGAPIALLLAAAVPGATSRPEASVIHLAILTLTIVLGFIWELAYHGLQQLRSERDWPSGLALLVGVPELALVHQFCDVMAIADSMSVLRFVLVTGVIWASIWAATQSAIRVVAPMWRFRGGRLT